MPSIFAFGSVNVVHRFARSYASGRLMGHHFFVSRIWTFAAFALLVFCAACTSSGPGTPPTSAATTSPAVSVPPPTTTAPSTSHGGPPRPPQPSLPADVPTTGPNTKPGEKPPIMPLEATQHTPDGAKAFAQFFIKTIDWGYATTSSTYMRHYFLTGCKSCTGFTDVLDIAKRAGHRFIGGRFTVTSAMLAKRPAAPSADYTVVVTFNDSSFEEITRRNKFVRADGAHRGEKFEVSAAWASDRWVVVDLAANQ
jgi:hypothetical protein